MRQISVYTWLTVLIFTVFLVSCEEKKLDPANPEKSFVYAKEPYDDGNYELALRKLGEFKARFPYSKYAAEAELLIANSHFESERYGEASAAYEHFIQLHPKHPKVEFAMYRMGESYWADAPEEIDREQEYTAKALIEWQKLVNTYPDGEYGKKAMGNIKLGKRRIAESENFVANFYCEQEIWHSCAYRSIRLADNYPEFMDLRKAAVSRAVEALENLAKLKQADPKSDKNLYFKTMTAGEIAAKAADLKQKLNSLK